MPYFGSGGGTSVADELTTAETDTAKRLAPDGAGGVEWGAGGSGLILEAHETLAASDILALHSALFELVAGVAGKVYLPISCTFVYHHVTTAYTVAPGFIEVLIGTVAAGPFVPFFDSSAIFENIFDQVTMPVFNNPCGSEGGTHLSDLEGASVSVYFNGASNPADGDGTLDVWVYYREITV